MPEGAASGDVLILSVEATDTAGNLATETAELTVAADGVIVGRVLDDRTGLPLAGAAVRVEGGEATTADSRGRYALASGDATALVAVELPGLTSVERRVAVESGVGTAPVDARLTPLGDAVVVDTAGGTLTSPELLIPTRAPRIEIPAGALRGPSELRLTPLSGQGLPRLLPLGFAPVSAFELSASAPLQLPVAAFFSQVPEGVLPPTVGGAATQGSSTAASIRNGQTFLNGLPIDGTLTARPDAMNDPLPRHDRERADNFANDRDFTDRSWLGELAELIIHDRALAWRAHV